jgi:two-component system chemotaxis sensor kinase CheA
MDQAGYAELFLSESTEHIAQVNRLLLELENDGGNTGAVEELFRSVHTLKGMSAAMEYSRSAELAHALEHLLDQVRTGAMAVDSEVTDALFNAVDALERAISGEMGGPRADAPAPTAPGAAPDAADNKPGGAFVRIREERLDRLVDQVGELVIARDRLRRVVGVREDDELGASSDEISRLTAELRDDIMRVRMVPVAEVFERFPRVVRDASRILGKRVDLEIHGGGVELDRSLVKELGDLLIHLVRNAVDHGIETPSERTAADKSPSGKLIIGAAVQGQRIIVRVADDGRGIGRDRVIETVIAKGWLAPARAREMTEDEIFHFITRAGFSTAEQVTSVSGRGVGLDVVATRVDALGGSVSLESVAGGGTTFTLRLPTTLSITRSLQVEVGGGIYLIPLSGVAEVIECTESDLRTQGENEFLEVREQTVRVVRLARVFEASGPRIGRGPLPIVVVDGGAGKLALVVDAFHGQHESVWKPFDAPAGTLPCFGGSALLADGRAALIIDPVRFAAARI